MGPIQGYPFSGPLHGVFSRVSPPGVPLSVCPIPECLIQGTPRDFPTDFPLGVRIEGVPSRVSALRGHVKGGHSRLALKCYQPKGFPSRCSLLGSATGLPLCVTPFEFPHLGSSNGVPNGLLSTGILNGVPRDESPKWFPRSVPHNLPPTVVPDSESPSGFLSGGSPSGFLLHGSSLRVPLWRAPSFVRRSCVPSVWSPPEVLLLVSPLKAVSLPEFPLGSPPVVPFSIFSSLVPSVHSLRFVPSLGSPVLSPRSHPFRVSLRFPLLGVPSRVSPLGGPFRCLLRG